MASRWTFRWCSPTAIQLMPMLTRSAIRSSERRLYWNQGRFAMTIFALSRPATGGARPLWRHAEHGQVSYQKDQIAVNKSFITSSLFGPAPVVIGTGVPSTTAQKVPPPGVEKFLTRLFSRPFPL